MYLEAMSGVLKYSKHVFHDPIVFKNILWSQTWPYAGYHQPLTKSNSALPVSSSFKTFHLGCL